MRFYMYVLDQTEKETDHKTVVVDNSKTTGEINWVRNKMPNNVFTLFQ